MDWDKLTATVKLVLVILIFILILLLFHVELRPLMKLLVDTLMKVVD